ncbi:hypothetical protein SAMD00019534_058540 [Acytostelium subglobosum LB1]|uniref:hypothetical protein n=1 Tax=Acytostelium subglobosum LB1 TaxID=1410327 RepID=UPI000644F27D|nr:hypothetical protein SAMD00019534_058540 [Acytostelium subglobosum LB1]GAM22679.1 hypothetical protein SAMD00019534_058540 [Acytostelium subglobosum LB1]|eukprot:XP_012754799.1 hypothetical protein SAMD00019534_058540 [Acytostelium subglobosum LB1]
MVNDNDNTNPHYSAHVHDDVAEEEDDDHIDHHQTTVDNNVGHLDDTDADGDDEEEDDGQNNQDDDDEMDIQGSYQGIPLVVQINNDTFLHQFNNTGTLYDHIQRQLQDQIQQQIDDQIQQQLDDQIQRQLELYLQQQDDDDGDGNQEMVDNQEEEEDGDVEEEEEGDQDMDYDDDDDDVYINYHNYTQSDVEVRSDPGHTRNVRFSFNPHPEHNDDDQEEEEDHYGEDTFHIFPRPYDTEYLQDFQGSWEAEQEVDNEDEDDEDEDVDVEDDDDDEVDDEDIMEDPIGCDSEADDDEDTDDMVAQTDKDDNSSKEESDDAGRVDSFLHLSRHSDQVLMFNPVVSKYGLAGLYVYNKLQKGKLIEFELGNHKFLSQMLSYYLLLYDKTTGKSIQQLYRFIRHLPSIHEAKKLIHEEMIIKELIPLKVSIDILEHYHRHNDTPVFKTYSNGVIPLLMSFYKRISNENLSIVNRHLRQTFDHIAGYTEVIPLYDKKSQYINFYQQQLASIRNLCGLNDKHSYFR